MVQRARAHGFASFFGSRRGARAEDGRDEERRDEARRARRAAAPEHGDDGVPEDEQFGRRCDRAEDDDYMQYERDEDEGLPESRRRARRAARAEEDGYRRYEDEDDDGDRDARRAEAGEGEGEDEDRDDDRREARRARRATRADAEDGDPDEDDDERELRGSSREASARRRERARCAAILGSGLAARNPELAMSLAFETNMTRQQALRTLARTPAAAPGATGRADRNPRIGDGGERSVSGGQAVQASWGSAFAKVGATKPQAAGGWDRAFAGQR
jgi:hypothetical protein